MMRAFAILLLLTSAIGGVAVWRGWDKQQTETATSSKLLSVKAERGTLDIVVEAPGTINTKDAYKLVALNKARAALEFAIDEGTRVKPGDLLLKLNSETLEDFILQETEDVANDQLLISDRETGLEIQKIEAKTNIESAENSLQAARLNQEKFISAERPQKIREAELALRTAESDVTRHGQRLEELRNLLAREFVTKSEVEEQELLHEKALVDRDGAKLALAALNTFEIPVTLQELTNKIDQAALNLRKADVTAKTKVALAERALAKAQDDWERSKQKLADLIDQRSAYEYRSPVGGIVFYGDTGVSSYRRMRTLEVGEDMSPGQVLMTIPIDSAMKAELSITESDIKKVKVGQGAEIRLDALGDQVFTGEVEQVAEAASDPGYFSTGIKEFAVKVDIKDHSELRQGFSCHVRILIDRVEDTVKVPVQAVFLEKKQHHVYLVDGTRKNVTVGPSSQTHVAILEGLAEGDEILLVRPES